MTDTPQNDQDASAGIYASRKNGMVPASSAPYKAIALADVVSGQFDDEEAAEAVKGGAGGAEWGALDGGEAVCGDSG